ncbi:MAG: hydantoinase/oxoprolinase family protein [Acidimicrobiia bacterium]
MRQLAIDVGGTFTDCLVLDDTGHLEKFKAPTTPDDPTRGLFDSLGKAAAHHDQTLEEFLAGTDRIVHGTTLGINVLLTGRGAKVGVITTAGFRDVLEIRRGIKNLHGSMFDQFVEPYRPLVPRHLRLGVTERTLYTGEILTPLAEDEVRDAARRLVREGCDAIAIGLLHSYANPTHEQRAREIVAEEAPAAHIATSHEILPVWREFERFSSTVVSAYIGPVIARYLEQLERELASHGFEGALLMMLANGLVQVVEQCVDRAVYLLGSGPAAAPSASQYVGALHGHQNLLSVDMGGTSFDVCLIRDGEVPRTTEAWVGEERVAIRMVDISSVGAGGGSIVWVDSLGLLRVGPMSAGADPGPAAYGRGDTATVTDADLALGYVPADFFLGGAIDLDVDRSRAALETVGRELGMTADETALATFSTVTSVMANAITEVCTKRGYDVRDLTMVAGGGAGGIHAAAIAQRLMIPEVIVPRVSALMSAFGMFTMDLGQEYARTRFRDLARVEPDTVAAIYTEMRDEAERAFAGVGVDPGGLHFTHTVDMRYAGQFHEVEIELPDGPVTQAALDELVRRFHDRYEVLYTYKLPWQPVEFLSFYLKVTSPRTALELAAHTGAGGSREEAPRGTRRCVFEDGPREVPVYDGDRLRPGDTLAGPALIDDPTTTVLVLDGFSCEVDPQRNLVLRSAAATAERAESYAAASG